MKQAALAGLLGLACLGQLYAQMQDNRTKSMTCADYNHRDDRAHHCEIREQTLAAVGRLSVDPGRNGGVTIKGWLDNQVLVRSRVETWADTDSDASLLASRVRVDANTGQVAATGPDPQSSDRGDSGWAVSYEIFVPQVSDLNLQSRNGGVSISDVRGRIEFTTRNGGVNLKRIAGEVSGSTLNGGVHIELAGSTWDGRQLEVSTKNGGVTVALPDTYSAHLRAETVNGGVRSEHPAITPQATPVSSRSRARNLDMNVGAGGPLIHVSTTNGGITLKRL
jgi:hypothetical protein